MAYSYDEYTGNGSTQLYTVTFGYIASTHVLVYVDGVSVGFTWNTSTQIYCDDAPANGTTVRIVRTTPLADRLVDFQNASLLVEEDLDKDSLQVFYAAQESADEVDTVMSQDDADGDWDAETAAIKNVVDPTAAQDAATKNYIDTTFTAQLNTAVTDAETAETNAEAAELKAEEWAEKAEDSEVETGQYSALHWTAKAEDEKEAAAVHVAKAADWAEEEEDTEVETGQYSALHWSAKAEAEKEAAAVHVAKAADWAEEEEDTEVETGQYSALHWAAKALQNGAPDALIQRCRFTYKDADEIYIDAGGYDLYGTGWVHFAARATYAFTGLDTDTWRYLYIDESEVSAAGVITASELTESDTGPTYDAAKGGWYMSDDRCIFATYGTAADTQKIFYQYGNAVFYDTSESDRSTATFTTDWVDVTLTVPSFCRRAFGTCNMALLSNTTCSGRVRTNGSGSTYGHRAGVVETGSTRSVMEVVFNLDSNLKIEVKADTTDGNLQLQLGGYFLPDDI